MDEPFERLSEDGVLIARKNDVLAEICRAIVRSASAGAVVQDVAVRLQRYFGTASVGIWFREGDELILEGICLPDPLQARFEESIRSRWRRTPLDSDLPGSQAMRARATLRWPVGDPTLDPAVRRLLSELEVDGIIAVPAYVEGEPTGCAIIGYTHERPLTAADEALLESAIGVVAIVYQRARLQENERERQRNAVDLSHLATLGEFAAGLAHEINNPLDAVVHLAELLLADARDPESVRRLGALLQEARRASNVLASLRLFAQEEPEEKAPTRLADLVEEVLTVMRTRLSLAGIDVELRLDRNMAVVAAASQLRRALHHVLTNARQAMEADAHGKLRIEVRGGGPMAEVVVDDTGPGLSNEVRSGLFRPFFTRGRTRPAAGLGLSLTYGIVTEHGGEVVAGNWGEPRVLGGTTGEGGARIILRLPAADRLDDAESGGEQEGVAAREVGPLAILVVEDEPTVARPLLSYLERRGHSVAHALDAEEAVGVLESPEQPDVILSDVRMPGMGGIGLYEEVQRRWPHLLEGLVFLSGDVLTPETRRFLESTGRPYLSKPYSFGELDGVLSALAK